jgi:predicted GNAT family acetyltransferase
MNIRNVQLTVTRQQYSNLESAADLVRTDVIELLGVEGLDQDTSAKISQLMADVDQMCQQMHYLAEVSI